MKKFKKTWKSCVALACVASMSLGTMTVFAESCGDGNHDIWDDWQDAWYVECYGGWAEDYTWCMSCDAAVNREGKEVEWLEATADHVFGELNEPNFTACGGGYRVPYYICEVCDGAYDEDGNELYYEGGDYELHELGEFFDGPNYTPCMGGYDEDQYSCKYCDVLLAKDGELIWLEGDGKHKVGRFVCEADYTSCGGGIKVRMKQERAQANMISILMLSVSMIQRMMVLQMK